MRTISATELARNSREVLDLVATRGETVAVERNHALIAMVIPAAPTMTAAQTLAGLPRPVLSAAQAAAWLNDGLQGLGDSVPDPWA